MPKPRCRPARALLTGLLPALLTAGAAGAAPRTIDLVGDVNLIFAGSGPPIPVMVGETADISVEYDDAATESALTVNDPVLSTFTGSVLGLDVYFRTSDLLFSFGSGGFASGIMIQDNAGQQGVSLSDNITVSTSDPIDTPLIEGLPVVVGTFAITENISIVQGGAIPDMLIRQDLLPQGPIDVTTTGSFVTLLTLSLQGQSPSGSISFANVQLAPEPGIGIATGCALATIGVLAARRRWAAR